MYHTCIQNKILEFELEHVHVFSAKKTHCWPPLNSHHIKFDHFPAAARLYILDGSCFPLEACLFLVLCRYLVLYTWIGEPCALVGIITLSVIGYSRSSTFLVEKCLRRQWLQRKRVTTLHAPLDTCLYRRSHAPSLADTCSPADHNICAPRYPHLRKKSVNYVRTDNKHTKINGLALQTVYCEL